MSEKLTRKADFMEGRLGVMLGPQPNAATYLAAAMVVDDDLWPTVRRELEHYEAYARQHGETAAWLDVVYVVAKLRKDVREKESRLAKLEAQAVDTRVALEEATSALELLHPTMNPQEPCVVYKAWRLCKDVLAVMKGGGSVTQ